MAQTGRESSRRRRFLLTAGALAALAWYVSVAARQLSAGDPVKPSGPTQSAIPQLPEQTKVINEHVAAGWKENHLTASRPATDYEFIRRASLDIIGRIATPDEIRQFLADPASRRRALLVDRLVNGPEYARNWASVWSVWLLTRSGPAEYHRQMRDWLKDQFAKSSQGFDKTVMELLTATGKNTENGAVNFILAHLGESVPPDKAMEEGQFTMVPITSRTTRVFLGLQIQCTQCHDHPFNPQWKQQHFWGVNAYFRQVERKGVPVARNQPAPNQELVDNVNWNTDSVVFYEKRNGVVQPTRAVFVDGKKFDSKSQLTRRQELAELIVKHENFPKALVNRMWAHFFGKGMNSPGAFDDFGEHNQVTHPKLLEYLAKEFKEYSYNPRALIRWICNSDAYGLSTVVNSTNDKPDVEPFCSRMLLKAMSPEQLFESLMVATQAEKAETQAKRDELRDKWMKNLIVNFGDDEGNEVTFNGTVVQALILMNGKEINDAISAKDKGPVIAALTRRGASLRTIMDDIYLAVLNRKPTSLEYQEIPKKLRTRVIEKDITAPWQDLMWALVNSNEFILNH